jgi:hypothetical protein
MCTKLRIVARPPARPVLQAIRVNVLQIFAPQYGPNPVAHDGERLQGVVGRYVGIYEVVCNNFLIMEVPSQAYRERSKQELLMNTDTKDPTQDTTIPPAPVDPSEISTLNLSEVRISQRLRRDEQANTHFLRFGARAALRRGKGSSSR